MYKFMIAMLAMLMLTGAAFAQDADEPVRCDYCGMYWDNSSTRLEIDMTVDGKAASHTFESIGCLMNSMDELKEAGAKEIKVESAMILDYSTFGTDNEMMIDAMKATYLVDTKKLQGSMGPFIAAFSNTDAAKKMQKSLGGDVMTHDQMHAWMSGDDEKMEHDHGGGMMADLYVCPCSGNCCDDIKSDKPGECSKCGMTLVKKSEK